MLRSGSDDRTVLWLRLTRGRTVDSGPSRHAVSVTGDPLRWRGDADGAGRGLLFGVAAVRLLTVATTNATLDVGDALRWSFWLRPGDTTERPVLARRTTSDAVVWRITASGSDYVSLTVGQQDGTLQSLEVDVRRVGSGYLDAHRRARRVHVACEAAVGGNLRIWLDGQLWASAPCTLADIADEDLADPEVGGDSYAAEQYEGEIGDVQVWASPAALTVQELPANLGPARATGRSVACAEVDALEYLQGETWTSDSGAYYLALSGATLDAFVLVPGDVTGAWSDGTALTEVGAPAGLFAGAYCVDLVNRRLWAKDDPEAATSWAVAVRLRLATQRLRRGFGSYLPALRSSDAGEQSMPRWTEPYPTGTGLSLEAWNHPDLPTNLIDQSTSRVGLVGAQVRARVWSDGLAWDQVDTTFCGYVDEPPTRTQDGFSVRALGEPAKLYKAPLEQGPPVLDRETWANADPAALGYQWPRIEGQGHMRLRAPVVDVTGAGIYRRKVCNHGIASIDGWWIGTVAAEQPGLYNVDLSVAEFYTAEGPDIDVYVDVGGYATSWSGGATTAGPVRAFGSASDALVTPQAQLQQALADGMGETPTYGSTWATTAGRVAAWRRQAQPESQDGSLARWVRRHGTELLTWLYFRADTEQWEWEDLVKADPVDWYIQDGDEIDAEIETSRDLMASRANAAAWSYVKNPDGLFVLGEPTTLSLSPRTQSGVRDSWSPPAARTGYYERSAAYAYLQRVQPALENEMLFYRATLPARFAGVREMDVLSIGSATLPSGVGARFRVYRHARTGGGVRVEAFSEDNFPATGSVSLGTRPNVSPAPRYSWGVIPFARADDYETWAGTFGAWVSVDRTATIIQGGHAYPSGVTHRIAWRVGGNTGCDMRLRDLTNSQTLAQVTCPGVYPNTVVSASVANIPSGDALVAVQRYMGDGNVVFAGAIQWDVEEPGSMTLADPVSPIRLWSAGWASGQGHTATTQSRVANFAAGIWSSLAQPPGAVYRWVVYADGSGAVDFTLKIVDGYWQRTMVDFGTITAAGFYEGTWVSPPSQAVAPFYLVGSVSGGAGTVYAASCELVHAAKGPRLIPLSNWGPSPAAAVGAGGWFLLTPQFVRPGTIGLLDDATVTFRSLAVFYGSQSTMGSGVKVRVRDVDEPTTLVAAYDIPPGWIHEMAGPLGFSATDDNLVVVEVDNGGLVAATTPLVGARFEAVIP